MGKVKVYADELAAGNDAKILSNNPITLTQSEPLISMNGTDLVTKDNLSEFAPIVVTHFAEIGDPDVYTLTVGELADVNTYGRYPNFVAIVVNATGRQFFDIIPEYDGNPGAFTAVNVQLHGDGAGVNVDGTFIQFS